MDLSVGVIDMFLCKCSTYHTLRYFNTAIDQLQQHPDRMLPGWVTGRTRMCVHVQAKDNDSCKE